MCFDATKKVLRAMSTKGEAAEGASGGDVARPLQDHGAPKRSATREIKPSSRVRSCLVAPQGQKKSSEARSISEDWRWSPFHSEGGRKEKPRPRFTVR